MSWNLNTMRFRDDWTFRAIIHWQYDDWFLQKEQSYSLYSLYYMPIHPNTAWGSIFGPYKHTHETHPRCFRYDWRILTDSCCLQTIIDRWILSKDFSRQAIPLRGAVWGGVTRGWVEWCGDDKPVMWGLDHDIRIPMKQPGFNESKARFLWLRWRWLVTVGFLLEKVGPGSSYKWSYTL